MVPLWFELENLPFFFFNTLLIYLIRQRLFSSSFKFKSQWTWCLLTTTTKKFKFCKIWFSISYGLCFLYLVSEILLPPDSKHRLLYFLLKGLYWANHILADTCLPGTSFYEWCELGPNFMFFHVDNLLSWQRLSNAPFFPPDTQWNVCCRPHFCMGGAVSGLSVLLAFLLANSALFILL